jgi:hypothetical protein
VLDADALLIDDDMPKVLNADALLPDDDNNDARWHGTVMAPFCLFFVFPKGHQRHAATTPVSDFVVIRDVLQ